MAFLFSCLPFLPFPPPFSFLKLTPESSIKSHCQGAWLGSLRDTLYLIGIVDSLTFGRTETEVGGGGKRREESAEGMRRLCRQNADGFEKGIRPTEGMAVILSGL